MRLSAALALLLVANACEARLALGVGCTLTSECTAPLACVAGRCRSECASARDCPRGAICLAGEGGTSACQTPEDTGCSSTAECAGRLVCEGAQCTNECERDDECRAGAFCAAGACVECETAGDCPSGLVCRTARCVPECDTDADCTGGRSCLQGRCGVADGGLRDAGSTAVPDRCEDARSIVLAGPRTTLSIGSTASWTDDAESCSLTPDAYFRFHLDRRSVVAVAAIGVLAGEGSVDGLGWVDARCTGGGARCDALDCGDDAGRRLVAVLEPGDHGLVVDAIGESSLQIDVVPIGLDTVAIGSVDGVTTRTVTLTGEGGGFCGAGGADAVLYGMTCVSAAFRVDVCAAPVALALGHPTGAPGVCAEAPVGTTACDGSRAALDSSGGPGLHLVTVSAAAAGGPLDVTFRVEATLD